MPSVEALFEPIAFTRGPAWKNRFMLAPLTNQQSHPNGLLSEAEHRWLTMRATGGFGLTMTCAAHVAAQGQGFPGQLGIFADDHIPGLTRLADDIRAAGSVSSVQLHHAGNRSPKDLVGVPLCPSDDPATGARAFTAEEVQGLVESFVRGAERAEQAGFDGVEVHGAHGYVIAQFLSPTLNRRTDGYGGSVENRARLLFEIIDGIRARTRPDFQLGLRLSPERFDLQLAEILEVAQAVLKAGKIDYLDMSLWDVAKEPVEEAFKGRKLSAYFAELDRGQVKLGAAGKIMTPAEAAALLDEGYDFAVIGRAAILHHDFPEQARRDAGFTPVARPVSAAHLEAEGLSPAFVDYMRNWPGFVEAA
ncbi:NADH:flavin oxidoreductase [Phenylobacterium sp. J367]|uniref:NADH:flavin oxidoreductase n=1 Tax=Phenylobacterium sp. J367 TaxID=2898435 RepID=UPI002150D994|nr:NADH:flavin oxidoreductase [Phenylobacterium sp. J367]MCR5878932.1 NADH:flavin oxidoreductase [Phenylobacterium sp. J367]